MKLGAEDEKWVVGSSYFGKYMLDNVLFPGLWPWGPCSPLAALDEGAKELSCGLRAQMPVQLSSRHNRLWKMPGWIGSSEWHLISNLWLIYQLMMSNGRYAIVIPCHRLKLWCMPSQQRNWAYKWQMYSGCRKKSRNILGAHNRLKDVLPLPSAYLQYKI